MSDKKNDPYRDYLRFAGLGFEALAGILVFVGIGWGLDYYLEPDHSWFILGGALLGCAMAMYILIKNANKLGE